MLPLCVAAEKQTVKHGGGIVMLQKVGHAAQGEGNCRAGGTRCCSERKLQAVQRFLPGYDIIASRLDFSVWKRMKNLAGNLQPLIYGAFPVWRNCTVPENARQKLSGGAANEWSDLVPGGSASAESALRLQQKAACRSKNLQAAF